MKSGKGGIKSVGSKKSEDKISIDFVKWFSELNKDSGPVAGGKGANLGEISHTKTPVPPGFVVTAQAYDYFIEQAGIKEAIHKVLDLIDYEDTKQLDESTKKIRELITKSKLPKEMEEEIIESYENLDTSKIEIGKGLAHDILKNSSEPIFVAVRSSATTEDLAEASFAGQQDSFLNVKGNSDLIEHIKMCFASLFTSRATYYRNKKGFKHEQASLAVVVQKMVDSDKSGVIFSRDPFMKKDNVVMEAVWGLGEGIVSGQITPDRYEVSRELKILDIKVSEKKIAITRDSSGKKTVIKLRDEKSNHQVLKEFEMKKLAEIAMNLEDHYKKPQDIEFAIEGEEIFIVQTRPITTIDTRIEEGGKELKGEVILTGMPASPGIGVGKIKIVESMDDLEKVQKGDILVTKMTNPDMVVTMQRSSAIITDEGGMTAHAAIVSREMGIPCIVGTKEATIKLKDGEVITVDGSNGKVYKGKVAETAQKEVLPVTVGTKTKIKVIVDLPSFAERASKTKLTKVGLTRIEGIIAESGKHPNYFLKRKEIGQYEEVIFKGIKQISNYFEEIWVRTSDIRSDEYENLEGAPQQKEANPMLGMHGIRYGVKYPEILKSELKALKRVADKGTTIGLLLPQVISVEEVKKVKELAKEIGFENKVKFGVMIETPAAVQIIKDLCEEGIDFISFGTNDLTQYMLAIDRGNEQVQHLYNEMHPAVLYQLQYVIRVCKRYNVETSICGQAGSRKDMAKYLVEKGIDSISVNADVAKEISEYVAELEKGLVKGTDKEPRKYSPLEKKEIGIIKSNIQPSLEKVRNKFEHKKEFKEIKPEIKQSKESGESVLDEVKENIEKGLEKAEKIIEDVLDDKRGEISLSSQNGEDEINEEKLDEGQKDEVKEKREEEYSRNQESKVEESQEFGEEFDSEENTEDSVQEEDSGEIQDEKSEENIEEENIEEENPEEGQTEDFEESQNEEPEKELKKESIEEESSESQSEEDNFDEEFEEENTEESQDAEVKEEDSEESKKQEHEVLDIF